LILHVTQVQRLGGYVLALAFNDGKACEVDLDSSLWGSMFEPLRDKKRLIRYIYRMNWEQ